MPCETPARIRFEAQPGLGTWRVQVQRHGVTHAKRFPVLRHGSVEAARLAALAWREEVCANHPPRLRQEVVQQHRRNNTSGAPGVFRNCTKRRRPDGSLAIYWHWEARTPEGMLPARKRAFSVARYGEAVAFELAKQARRDFVSALVKSST